jgi:hypothetical protein
MFWSNILCPSSGANSEPSKHVAGLGKAMASGLTTCSVVIQQSLFIHFRWFLAWPTLLP